jgi:hypothetical protein
VVYVVADMGGKLDSPLYGMFAARSEIAGRALDGVEHAAGTLDEWFIKQPSAPDASYSIKWDGEWQVTYETFPRHGHRLRRRPDPDLPAGRRALQELSGAADHHGADPADHHRRHAGARLLGSQYTATSMIGMIALAGIIVRNSILLVDFIRQQVAEGMALREAIIQSASVRAKPIALTGLAAMLGAMFILDDPIFNGLAISLIFGIFVSTLLTLVVIPVLYYAAFRKENQT